jgi:hypothetical protein
MPASESGEKNAFPYFGFLKTGFQNKNFDSGFSFSVN